MSKLLYPLSKIIIRPDLNIPEDDENDSNCVNTHVIDEIDIEVDSQRPTLSLKKTKNESNNSIQMAHLKSKKDDKISKEVVKDQEEEEQEEEEETNDIEEYRIIKQSKKTWGKFEIKTKIINPIHRVKFSFSVFFEFFLYHLIYFFLLGPFIVIISPCCGMPLIWNMLFIGFNFFSILQAVQYVLIITSYSLYYLFEKANIHYIELYMITIALLIRCSMIASKYACSSSVYIHLIKTRRLKLEDLHNEMILFTWAAQSNDIIDEELQAAIFRENIDNSFFYFTFAKKIPPELRSLLAADIYPSSAEANKSSSSGDGNGHGVENDNDNGNNENEDHDHGHGHGFSRGEREKSQNGLRKPDKNNTSGGGNSGLRIPTENKMKFKVMKGENFEIESMENHHNTQNNEVKSAGLENKHRLRDIIQEKIIKKPERKSEFIGKKIRLTTPANVFKNMFAKILAKKSKLKDVKLSGYNLTKHIIQKSKLISVSYEKLITYLIPTLRAFIPVFYRIYLSKPPFGEGPIEIILIVCFIGINSFFFWANYSIIFKNLIDLKRKLYMMGQLSALLSTNKHMIYDVPINYPPINIFDAVSIKTWSNIRKIFMTYGQKFHQRNSFNIALYLFIYSIILIFLSLHFLKISSMYYDSLLLLVFGFESIAIFCVFGYMLFLGASLNEYFKIHRNYLKKNKTVISDLLRMQDLYFGEDSITPDDELYRRGVKLLKRRINDNNSNSNRNENNNDSNSGNNTENNKEKNEKRLTHYLSQLKSMLNDVIEELTYEEINNPYSILGYTIDYELLQKLFVGLFSLLIAFVQVTIFGQSYFAYYLNNDKDKIKFKGLLRFIGFIQ